MSKPFPSIEFGEIAEFRNGLNFSKDSHGKGCWLIGVADFKDNFTPNYDTLEEVNPEGITKKEDYLRKGDILFVRSNGNKALVGRSLYIDRDVNALFSGFCIRARLVNDIIAPLFLAYYTRTDHFKSSISFVAGTNINNLNQDILGNVKLPLYPKDVQLSIANVLSCIDKKIDLNQRINAELESIAKTLYDYWFVQFDFPNDKGKPYKSSGGKMVWNEELKRKIPVGWGAKRLGEELQTNLGGTPSTKNAEYWESATIPWLNSGDIANFPVNTPSAYITQKGVDNSATTILPKGSVVISVVRYIRPSIIAIDACTNQSVVGIRESKELKNTFIYPFLVNEVPRLMKLRTGAQQPHINKEIIDETCLCVPPANVLESYYNISEPVYKTIVNQAFENKQLTELRDWLLPMLMNGQVKVG